MRKPDHTKATRYANRHSCPHCGGKLTPNYEVAIIECANRCGWSGKSYETIHAFT